MVVVLGTAYLAWVGVIGGERSGFLAYTGVTGIPEYRGTIPPFVLRIGIYTRDLFAADWISWPVFLWFVALPLFIFLRHRRRVPPAPQERRADRNDRSRSCPTGREEAAAARGRQEPLVGDLPVAAAGGIVLMGALFALFAASLSVQPVWMLKEPYADLRYYMGALPLLLAMKGLFAEWVWRRSRVAAAAAAAVLLVSSAGAWPFNIPNLHTREPTLGLHLLQFVREIHRPYRDSIRVVSDYLLEHAAQDDLVYVPGFADREALTFTAGHRVLFCCVLDADSPLPPPTVESLGARLVLAGTTPDWIVLFGKLSEEYRDKVKAQYAVAAQPDVFFYPTQRPEINVHAFRPLPLRELGVHILQRRAGDKLYQAAAAPQRRQRDEEALASYREALEIDPRPRPSASGSGPDPVPAGALRGGAGGAAGGGCPGAGPAHGRAAAGAHGPGGVRAGTVRGGHAPLRARPAARPAERGGPRPPRPGAVPAAAVRDGARPVSEADRDQPRQRPGVRQHGGRAVLPGPARRSRSQLRARPLAGPGTGNGPRRHRADPQEARAARFVVAVKRAVTGADRRSSALCAADHSR